ncbi:stage V sporulation T C-terminal domain-containing protein [Ruminococcus flavefaciens]|uniref:stage V sporulation T C-terminal domain-containing protein n=1 Tax=Ruminococcus flavefaciens TaxID=1265 RepID=UPI00048ADB71|nr:stage V sporulation T C-terminal domain-containing protein [Ruminococcus flavefaciens]
MEDKLRIAGYCRISVDEELDRDNTSIENQKAIIADYVSKTFPTAELNFYEDRDRSGYTFEQREGYQKLRKKMLQHEYDILIIKDFSRFSRRNSKGLVELEDLRDAGMRIISIGDSIDYPTFDDWTAIQFRFLINEMPVTDTSKKVRSVVKRRQEEGKWICAVPYGYIMTNSKLMQFEVDEPAAEVVREIFRLYSEGWGYKRIANHLTDRHIPTPRMAEKERREAKGEECKLRGKNEWSIVTVSEILRNDFYIGTLRQGKYRRRKINGTDTKLEETDHLVFENNHTPIVDYKLFASVQEQMKRRTNSNYRGVKKYDNIYSGYLFCGDCGSPMFSMSRPDLSPAYRCGTYHQRGIKGCTSHHTRVDMLDGLLKSFVEKVRDNSAAMLEQLQESIDKERSETSSSKSVVEMLEQQMEDTRTEIKMLARQHVRDIAKHPEREEMLEEIYTEQIDELTLRLEGLRNQMQLAADKHNMIVNVNRTAKTVMEVFDAIVSKEKLTKVDVDFIIERITVYEEHVDIKLRPDIDTLLKTGVLPEHSNAETAVNFKQGTGITEEASRFAEITASNGKILSINVISEGDPLEIYTNNDGEVIFRKYSAVSEMSENAGYVADIMHKIAGCPVVIFDKDHVVATAGVPRKEFAERRVTGQLEELMENRGQFFCPDGSTNNFFPAEGVNRTAIAALPIITAGDVSGAVAFLTSEKCKEVTDLQKSLINASAQFLARQIEG